MIFVDINMSEEVKGHKIYKIKYVTLENLYKTFDKDVKNIPFIEITLEVDKCGLIDEKLNLKKYKELFYEFGDTRVLVSTKECGDLLLHLSQECPKNFPIRKVVVFEFILNSLNEAVGKQLDSDNNFDNPLFSDDLMKKYEDIKNIDDNFEKMIVAYKYKIHEFVSSFSNKSVLYETKKDIVDMYNKISSELNLSQSSIDEYISIINDSKKKLLETLQPSFDCLEKYEYELSPYDWSIFDNNNVYQYVPF